MARVAAYRCVIRLSVNKNPADRQVPELRSVSTRRRFSSQHRPIHLSSSSVRARGWRRCERFSSIEYDRGRPTVSRGLSRIGVLRRLMSRHHAVLWMPFSLCRPILCTRVGRVPLERREYPSSRESGSGAQALCSASDPPRCREHQRLASQASRTRLHLWVSVETLHVQLWLINRSSNAMPREVRAAIAWCISTEGAGAFSMDEAEKYVEEMFESGRGGEESW